MQITTASIAAILISNTIAFYAFWVDKNAAKNGTWRIRESTLLALAFFGGSIGAILGQQLLRHKTRKEPFRSRLVTIATLHVGICLATGGYLQAMLMSSFVSIA